LLERFSPYFQQPALGFADRSPAEAYRHVYRLPPDELRSLVYLFDTPLRGLSRDEAGRLIDRVHWWRDNYVDSSLTWEDHDDRIVVRDRRAGRDPATHVIDHPVLVAAYQELEHGRSARALHSRLRERSFTIGATELDRWLGDLHDNGLVFVEAGQIVTLATTAVPIKVAS